MSAWKKPSRIAWRRKLWITVSPSCFRSKPWAARPSTSAIGVPSIHLGGQHLARAAAPSRRFGTRNPGSSLVFSAISDMADASMRRSSSSFIDCSSMCDGRHGSEPAAFGAEALQQARGEVEALQVGSEALFDAGPQHLHRHDRGRRWSRPCVPARWRPQPPVAESSVNSCVHVGPMLARDDRAWPRPCGRAAGGPAAP